MVEEEEENGERRSVAKFRTCMWNRIVEEEEDKGQYHGKVVEPASEVDGVLNGVDQSHNLVAGPTDNESQTDHQRCHDSIAADSTHRCTVRRSRNLC